MEERRMERLVLLPFSFGCVSESSVAVGVVDPQPRPRTKPDSTDVKSIPPTTRKRREEDEESSSSSAQSVKRTPLKFLPLSKPRTSKLLKNFKNFAQLFVYKEEEIEELEMKIGYPTDVKHVTHIGLDGSSANTSPIQGWDHLTGPAELLSVKNATVDHPLKHVELTMATLQQADQPPPPLVKGSVDGHV